MAEPKFVDPADAVFVFPLQRPIKPFGVSLDQLAFREPTAGDITRVGLPVNYMPGTGPEGVRFDAPKMSAMMARLSQVPESSIDTLTTQDWTECAWGLARFFIAGLPTPKTPVAQPSSSPSTSAAAPTNS